MKNKGFNVFGKLLYSIYMGERQGKDPHINFKGEAVWKNATSL